MAMINVGLIVVVIATIHSRLMSILTEPTTTPHKLATIIIPLGILPNQHNKKHTYHCSHHSSPAGTYSPTNSSSSPSPPATSPGSQ